MEDEGFDLKWRNHLPEVFAVIRKLRAKEAFCDVLLFCEGEQFRAHRVILASSSTFFERMLSGVPAEKSSILVMTETRADLLHLILDFMYNGEVFVEADMLQVFMETAERLEIRGLRKVDESTVDPSSEEAAKRGKPSVARVPSPVSLPSSAANTAPLSHSARVVMGGGKKRPNQSADSDGDDLNNDCDDSDEAPMEKNGLPTPSKKIKSTIGVSASGGRKIFTGLPPGISIEPTGASKPETMKAGAIRVTALPRRTEQPSSNAIGGGKPNPGPSGVKQRVVIERDEEDDDDDEEIVELEDGNVKTEFGDSNDQGDYSNDAGDWTEEGTFSEEGFYADGGDDGEQYQFQSIPGGDSDERPQNIPPEISTSVPLRLWKPGSLVWQGTTVYSGNTVTTFFCGVCGYKSFNSGNVRMHAMTHTGEVPYKCSECDHGFRRKDRMKRHKYNVHNIVDSA